MFYSHQLLARKAPLGQIWMAATLHAKISRKQVDKLDIIKICEEILNPPLPMAQRLCAILMSGVVIVFQTKVKFLYDDVSRLVIEINRVWKHTPAVDRTVLPKGKSQAKYEAVTLPENLMDMEIEEPMFFSAADTAKFRGMRLDDVDEKYVNVNLHDDDVSHHQAEAANITLPDNFGSGLRESDLFNRFERFDIGGDDTTDNIAPDEHTKVPSTFVPSPPRQESPPQQELHNAAPPPVQGPQQGDSAQKQEEQKMKGQRPTRPLKRKARGRSPQVIMDNQIMIPGNIYQTWLQDPSDLVSKRRRVNTKVNLMRSMKIRDLMDLPPVALISSLKSSPSELHYPELLLKLWKECTEVKSPKASSAGGRGQQPRNSDPRELSPQPPGEYQREMGAPPNDLTDDIEKMRANKSAEPELGDALQEGYSITPGSPGLSRRSVSSSGGSGRGFMPLEPEVLLPSGSGRSKRKQNSSGRSLGNLDPVVEEFPLEQDLRDFKLRRFPDIGPTPDLLEETDPTQIPFQKNSDPADKEVTETIQSYLKHHFDSLGAPETESLDNLAIGMTKTQAAQLLYQSCVLATLGCISVTQLEPYGEISISRGPKM